MLLNYHNKNKLLFLPFFRAVLWNNFGFFKTRKGTEGNAGGKIASLISRALPSIVERQKRESLVFMSSRTRSFMSERDRGDCVSAIKENWRKRKIHSLAIFTNFHILSDPNESEILYSVISHEQQIVKRVILNWINYQGRFNKRWKYFITIDNRKIFYEEFMGD